MPWPICWSRWPKSRPRAASWTDTTRRCSDDAFVALMDSFAVDAHPMIERLQELMVERGWSGWSRIERAAEPSATLESRP